eukprot:TRINITY_DN8363_c0_g1_i1.p1 TRINITY_DN8363_c0_g1~~TRINITY_DN8363_c0_g1_i1.p1  ORF type:complete len:101 (+),score=22.19 TRINITY_DN8363_c0_g1_i1:409-711(+)
MDYIYQHDADNRGVFTKFVKHAGAILQLPTVILEVITDVTGQAVLYSEFTCKLDVIELRFSSRVSNISDAELALLKENAIAAGIEPAQVNKVHRNDYSKC